MLKTLRGKRNLARKLLDHMLEWARWYTPHYGEWHKKQYRPALLHWKNKDMNFIGNRVKFLVYQGQNKGYPVASPQDHAYEKMWHFALRCYGYTNPLVDPGPMRPYFFTDLFVRWVKEEINQKPPKDLQRRISFYQQRAIYIQSLHALGLDGYVSDRIDHGEPCENNEMSW